LLIPSQVDQDGHR